MASESSYYDIDAILAEEELVPCTTNFDFSHLFIRQAYLANATLHNVDFTNSQISQTIFAETFGGVVCVTYSPDGKRFATSDTKGDIIVLVQSQ